MVRVEEGPYLPRHWSWGHCQGDHWGCENTHYSSYYYCSRLVCAMVIILIPNFSNLWLNCKYLSLCIVGKQHLELYHQAREVNPIFSFNAMRDAGCLLQTQGLPYFPDNSDK